MIAGSLVTPKRNSTGLWYLNGNPFNTFYGPKKGDIVTVGDAGPCDCGCGVHSITLIEYPQMNWINADAFVEIQPPLSICISDLLPESKEHAAIALEPA